MQVRLLRLDSKKESIIHVHISEAPSSDANTNFAIQFKESWTEPQGTDDKNIAVLFTALCTAHTEQVFQDLFLRMNVCIPN